MLISAANQGTFSISFLTGTPGSGKSYAVTRYLVEERLINTEARIVSNLPLRVDVIAEYVAEKRGCSFEEVAERLIMLEKDELKRWKSGNGGPWEVAQRAGSSGMAGHDFILDECHNFCKRSAAKRMPMWEEWLGEVRHEGWNNLLFISQDEAKVGKPISLHAEVRVELTNSATRRDPWFKIPLGDWYELLASFTRNYEPRTWKTEFRKVAGKWSRKAEHSESFTIDPHYFQFYESFSAPGGGAEEGAASIQKREWEKRPRFAMGKDDNGRTVLPVWAWFAKRHLFALGSRGAVVGLLGYVLTGGGGDLMGAYMDGVGSLAGVPTEVEASAEVEQVEEALPPVFKSVVVKRGETSAAATPPAIEADPEPEPGPRLLMVMNERCVFEDGTSYRMGERIRAGEFAGIKVRIVDARERLIELSSGHIFRIGDNLDSRAGLYANASAGDTDDAGIGDKPASVSADLPRVTPGYFDSGQKSAWGVRTQVDTVGAGNAAGDLR